MIYGPTSNAQVTLQAAEQIRQFGALPPFSVSSPLAPLLVGLAASVPGISEQGAYVALVAAAYCGGCAAVFFLVKSLYQENIFAGASALLFAVAPSRIYFVFEGHDAAGLLFWSLGPFLAAAAVGFSRGRTPLRLALVVGIMALCLATLPVAWGGMDLLALAELCAVSTLPALVPRRSFVASAGVGLAVLLAPSVWLSGIYPRLVYQPSEMPEEAVAWAKEFSTGGRIFGPVSLEVLSNPHWRRADQVIRGSGRIGESLMWLQAMGTEYLISRDWPKFHPLLECAYQAGEWCVYRVPAPSHGKTLFVSKRQRGSLKPIRGPFDVEGLEAYLRWAQRPELAGIDRDAAAEAEVQADLGPFDVILVKIPFRPGWSAWVRSEGGNERQIEVSADPLGFLVVDPGEIGRVSVRLEYSPTWHQRLLPAQEERNLIEKDFPIISRDGIAGALDYSPPPFGPGQILSIFGRNFVPADTRVLFNGESGEVIYAGAQQINVRVPQELEPGSVEVVVESEGRRSYPKIVEVSR